MAGVVERCDQVEVGKIKAEKGGTWSGDNTVEEEFGGGEIGSWRVGFAVIVDEIAADGEAYAVWVGLLGTIVCADVQVGWLLGFGQLVRMDEMERVGACVAAVFASLCKTGDFLGASLFPKSFVLAFEKVAVFFEFSSVGIQDSIEFVEGIRGRIGSALDFGIDELLELGWQCNGGQDGVVGL